MLRFLRNLIATDMVRWWIALRNPHPEIRAYYGKDFATLDAPWRKVECLAIDLETTGLNSRKDRIVSLGWVPIRDGALVLAEAEHWLVQSDMAMPEESAVLHGILDDHLRDAPPLADALKALLRAMAGRVPVAHHARVEAKFLAAALMAEFNCPLEVPFIDTLVLERRMFDKRGDTPKAGELRLNACRRRYGLPRYKAHDALLDALACGELYLAQAAHMDDARLDDLLA